MEKKENILHHSTIQEHSLVKWKIQIHFPFLPEAIQILFNDASPSSNCGILWVGHCSLLPTDVQKKQIPHPHPKPYQQFRLYFDLCLLTFPQEDQCLSCYAFRHPELNDPLLPFHGQVNPKRMSLHFSYNPVDSKMTVWNFNLLLQLQAFKNQNQQLIFFLTDF